MALLVVRASVIVEVSSDTAPPQVEPLALPASVHTCQGLCACEHGVGGIGRAAAIRGWPDSPQIPLGVAVSFC